MAKAKKLPSGAYRVQASIVIDGKLVRKSFTDPDPRKAEAAALSWQAQKAEMSKIESITLKEAYERCLAAKKNVLSPSTLRSYEQLKNNTLGDIMQIRLDKLTNETIQRSINIYAADHSPKSVRNCFGLLTVVLAMFRPEFHLNIKLPQKEKKDMYIPDDDDIKKLLKAAEGTPLEVPILLAAFGPMRRGEICALTSDDIDGNVITVNKDLVKDSDGKWVLSSPKTFGSYRKIEYPDFVIKKLQGIDGPIVTMTPNAITSAFIKLLKRNDLPKYRFHDLRHYAVSSLHAINVPDKYIMARGGWSSTYTMHQVYNHILKSAAEKLDDKISAHFSSVYDNEE